jgi:acyl-CoA dehydrogenase
MSAMREILADTAARLFKELCTNERREAAEKGGHSAEAWAALEDTEMTKATLSEARGGAGADIGDALALMRVAGEFALPLPLAETLLAELALAAAGLPPQSGVGAVGPVVRSIAPLQLAKSSGGWELSGTLVRVPAARHATHLAALAQYQGRWITVLVSGADLVAAVAKRDLNWADEPRDTVVFERLSLPHEAVGAPGNGWSDEDLIFNGAMFRVAAMAGALSAILDQSVRYAKDRLQFGRPIGGFQAVQHQLAIMASQVAAAIAASDAMSGAAMLGPARFEIAAAKARVGEAAHVASGIAHQVHGAIGFSQEYSLHCSTRRLWAWRDEFGTEIEWSEWLGRVATRVGGDGLWPLLTADDKSYATDSAESVIRQ